MRCQPSPDSLLGLLIVARRSAPEEGSARRVNLLEAPRPARRAFTAEDDAAIIADAAAGLPRAHTARRIDRSEDDVRRRVMTLRQNGVAVNGIATLPPAAIRAARKKTVTRRACLCCRKPFDSSGPGNRLCPTCRSKSTSPFDSPVTFA